MQITGPSYIHAPHSVNAPHAARGSQSIGAANTSAAITDQLDISAAGQFADMMSSIPDIRQDRVSALRAAIAEGTYETDQKLSVALDRLLDEIG
jgi:negative regulator of flagellin synthesis FlgM